MRIVSVNNIIIKQRKTENKGSD